MLVLPVTEILIYVCYEDNSLKYPGVMAHRSYDLDVCDILFLYGECFIEIIRNANKAQNLRGLEQYKKI